MQTKDDLGRLIDYTVWANHRVLRVAATLSVDDFKRDLRSSHGGVRGTLTHMLWAEWLWLERWKGVPASQVIDESEFADLVQLRDRWAVVDEHRRVWFSALRPESPGEIVHYRNTKGVAFEAPLWQLVQHQANHSSYHRGQVITLARQLGARAVSTDLLSWDRERALRVDGSSPAPS
jgi:uncharacterized damage-inducible protein DinB